MMRTTMCLAVLLVACGGGKKAETTPEGGGLPERTYENQPQNDGAMIPPEKLAEIDNLLDRKRRVISRCLADAVDAKEVPKNASGKILLEIVISTSGSPDTVKVIKSSLESEMLKNCVVGHVKSIQFPDLPREYPTSYSYGFEAI